MTLNWFQLSRSTARSEWPHPSQSFSVTIRIVLASCQIRIEYEENMINHCPLSTDRNILILLYFSHDYEWAEGGEIFRIQFISNFHIQSKLYPTDSFLSKRERKKEGKSWRYNIEETWTVDIDYRQANSTSHGIQLFRMGFIETTAFELRSFFSPFCCLPNVLYIFGFVYSLLFFLLLVTNCLQFVTILFSMP